MCYSLHKMCVTVISHTRMSLPSLLQAPIRHPMTTGFEVMSVRVCHHVHSSAVGYRFLPAQLAELDDEGRCVITDHGAFAVFNLVGDGLCQLCVCNAAVTSELTV